MIDEFGNKIGNNITGLNLTSPKVHERYKQLHESLTDCIERVVPVVFSLMRSCVLKRTPLVANYVGSDIPLAAEFALRGEFCEIPEPLFYQRWHAENSSLGNEHRPEMVAVRYDPKNKGKIVFHRWRWLFEFLRSIRRVGDEPKRKSIVLYAGGKMGVMVVQSFSIRCGCSYNCGAARVR